MILLTRLGRWSCDPGHGGERRKASNCILSFSVLILQWRRMSNKPSAVWFRRLKIAAVGLLTLVVAIVGLLQLSPVATWLVRRLVPLAPLNPGYSLQVGRVGGTWLDGLVLENVALLRGTREVARIGRLRVGYRIPNLVATPIRIREIDVDGVRATARREGDTWDLANVLRRSADTTGGGGIEVGVIDVRDGAMVAELSPDSVLRVRGLSMLVRDLAVGDVVTARIDRLNVAVAPPTSSTWFAVSTRGQAAADLFSFDPVRVQTERSDLAGRVVAAATAGRHASPGQARHPPQGLAPFTRRHRAAGSCRCLQRRSELRPDGVGPVRRGQRPAGRGGQARRRGSVRLDPARSWPADRIPAARNGSPARPLDPRERRPIRADQRHGRRRSPGHESGQRHRNDRGAPDAVGHRNHADRAARPSYRPGGRPRRHSTPWRRPPGGAGARRLGQALRLDSGLSLGRVGHGDPRNRGDGPGIGGSGVGLAARYPSADRGLGVRAGHRPSHRPARPRGAAPGRATNSIRQSRRSRSRTAGSSPVPS